MPEIQPVGSHDTWFEEPGLIGLRLKGDVSLEESAALADIHTEMARACKAIYMLVDMTEFGSGTPAGRKVTSETLTRMPVRGIAICRAKLTSKVMAKLVFAGVRLFRKDVKFEIEFFDHEAAAREWIAERRSAAAAA
jgi:hypothetical protein